MNKLNLQNLWLIVLVILSGIIGIIFFIIFSKLLNKKVFSEKSIVVLEPRNTFFKPASTITKRLFDVIFSLLTSLFVLGWLFPVLAIIIKLTSKGPVLIRRPIIGQFGKRILIYQFRTHSMLLQDSREKCVLTDIGKFLINTSLNEMPTFFNVLVGDMSVVGRSREYCFSSKLKVLDEQTRNTILSLRPGIVSLKSVIGKGKDGREPYSFDLAYAYTQNLFLDFKIILRAYIRLLVSTGDY